MDQEIEDFCFAGYVLLSVIAAINSSISIGH